MARKYELQPLSLCPTLSTSSAGPTPGQAFSTLPNRFLAPINDDTVDQAAKKSVPKTTEQATHWTLILWKEWQQNRKNRGVAHPPAVPNLVLNAPTLNDWMCKFILEVCCKDGAEYPPNS